MNDNELFELCKSVYEATGWEPVKELQGEKINNRSPLYTSDYLLEKLPHTVMNEYEDVFPFVLYPGKYTKLWYAGYEGYFGGNVQGSDTPLKALLKLTLELSKKGLLDAKDN